MRFGVTIAAPRQVLAMGPLAESLGYDLGLGQSGDLAHITGLMVHIAQKVMPHFRRVQSP